MGRKLGTSDLHFGHTNILKFTKRAECMKADLQHFPSVLWEQYQTIDDGHIKRMMTNQHDILVIE